MEDLEDFLVIVLGAFLVVGTLPMPLEPWERWLSQDDSSVVSDCLEREKEAREAVLPG